MSALEIQQMPRSEKLKLMEIFVGGFEPGRGGIGIARVAC